MQYSPQNMFLFLFHCFLSLDCYCRLLENWKFITARDTEFHHVIWSFIILSPGVYVAFFYVMMLDWQLGIYQLHCMITVVCQETSMTPILT